MKSVLLFVSDDGSMEARLEAALNIARTFDAVLTCVQAVPLEVLVGTDTYGGLYTTQALVEEFHEREALQRLRVEERLTGAGVTWVWRKINQDPAIAIMGNCLSDLVILGLCQNSAVGADRSLISDIALSVRTPVLVLPEGTCPFDCSGAAVIAWNGSVEAAHALRSALPFLTRAASVQIVRVDDDDAGLPAAAAHEYLARYGIAAELCDWQKKGRRVSGVLLEGAKLAEAYVVAGAYSHTRFREAVLGGVTRELIHGSPVPLLLAH